MTTPTYPRSATSSESAAAVTNPSHKRSDKGAYVALGLVLAIGLLPLLTATLLATHVAAQPIDARVFHSASSGQTGLGQSGMGMGMGMGQSSAISNHVTLTIVAQKPGSSVQGPAYTPTTNLNFPAHSLVTITIINQDAGDTALPANSPFANVSGVTGGVAYVDGQAYNALDAAKVAHTFTIPQLGVNVPIPGDTPQGKRGITVTFSFKTGAAGMYMWRCMDPCGSSTNGWGGPMAMSGFMQGMIMVH